MLIFSVLGALEINVPGQKIEISGELQRTLLQTLLVGEGESVSSEALMRRMWGESMWDVQPNTLYAHISRLRRRLRALEPERTEPRLTVHPSGYRLALGEGELDATEFVKKINSIEAGKSNSPGDSVRLLREALAMWRGPAFGDAARTPACRRAAARYEAYRLRALELLFGAELENGNHATILAELYETHLAHPLHERYCELLMIAFYRSGRQADALETYRRMWRHLADELGVRPSPQLQRTEQAILSHDPALDHPAVPPDVPAPPAPWARCPVLS
ncbi:AfsR/SARP family transcriptional regulator [Streptomyces sp. HU2014]|uniref:AfsR/SARP family transcriptional regulator n=1 Tax=Streptomyces sp. HU2014 TaxID=2939414 RepID=UPI00200C78D5|nr:AfsR/SARP family transcriptional regulator [Streptomyces sp. HU2014]UQI45129.1 AfsR/SARP family transcriptional regulator [Streptomyces sp. HU2014]